MTRWGIVSTIKARPKDVLNFVAYHLEEGADHIHIFLDNSNPKAEAALKAHPKVTVTRTDDVYWQERHGRKPTKHQVRQTINATYAYENAENLDWLLHIDVDEFISSPHPVAERLSNLPSGIKCARVHPAESLATDGIEGLDPAATYCKAWMPAEIKRRDLEVQIYPNFGGYLRGGFVSHFVGKIFVRTGLGPLHFRIHRATQQGEELEPQIALSDVDLCHRHITSWEGWQKVMGYRMRKGSYRKDLKPTRSPEAGGMSLHELFSFLQADGDAMALRAFFEEVCLARPELLETLRAHDLLKVFHLDLDAKRNKHFPDWRNSVAQ